MDIVMHGGGIRECIIPGYHEAPAIAPEVARHGAPRDWEELDQPSHVKQGPSLPSPKFLRPSKRKSLWDLGNSFNLGQ